MYMKLIRAVLFIVTFLCVPALYAAEPLDDYRRLQESLVDMCAMTRTTLEQKEPDEWLQIAALQFKEAVSLYTALETIVTMDILFSLIAKVAQAERLTRYDETEWKAVAQQLKILMNRFPPSIINDAIPDAVVDLAFTIDNMIAAKKYISKIALYYLHFLESTDRFVDILAMQSNNAIVQACAATHHRAMKVLMAREAVFDVKAALKKQDKKTAQDALIYLNRIMAVQNEFSFAALRKLQELDRSMHQVMATWMHPSPDSIQAALTLFNSVADELLSLLAQEVQ
jgi:hypothetical protein